MEHRIGTIVTLSDGRQAEVVEACAWCHCNGCKFILCAPLCHAVKCHAVFRTDHKNIIYREIKGE